MMTTRTKTEVQKEINALSGVEYLVETNEGTFGAQEAAKAVGTGDPAYTVRKVFVTVGGSTYSTGPTEEKAPGRIRKLNQTALAADRKRLANLQNELKTAK